MNLESLLIEKKNHRIYNELKLSRKSKGLANKKESIKWRRQHQHNVNHKKRLEAIIRGNIAKFINRTLMRRRMQNKKNNPRHKTNDITFTIKKPKLELYTIEILMKINETKLIALIDTGSVDNYLPEHFAWKLNLNVKNKEAAKKIDMADRMLVEVTQDTNAEFQLFGDRK